MNKKLLAVLAVATVAGQAYAFDAKEFAKSVGGNVKGAFKFGIACLSPVGSIKDKEIEVVEQRSYEAAVLGQLSKEFPFENFENGVKVSLAVDQNGNPIPANDQTQNPVQVNEKVKKQVTAAEQLNRIANNPNASKTNLVWYARTRLGWTGNILATGALIGAYATVNQVGPALNKAANFFSDDEDEDEDEDDEKDNA